MNSLVELLEEYTFKEHNLINKICEPLSRYFGMDYFSYQKVYADGRFWAFSNNLDWGEHFVKHDLAKSAPFITHPKNIASATLQSEDLAYIQHFADFNRDLKRIVGAGNCFLKLIKDEGCSEVYMFATKDPANYHTCQLFLADKQLIGKFVKYFNEKIERLQQRSKVVYGNAYEFKGDRFNTLNIPLSLKISQAHKQNFLAKIQQIDPSQCDVYLTPREIDCILALKRGLTAQETAEKLALSSRTVEGYLANVKKKLGIRHKFLIVPKAEELELI